MRFCALCAFQVSKMSTALSRGERVSRSGAFTSPSGTGEGSVGSDAKRIGSARSALFGEP